MQRLAAVVMSSTWRWLLHLGGPGLILIGIADNSVVPLTGSMDVLTMWLAAHHRQIWPYYAVMATVGAVLGGYITYLLGRKGGREAIERRFNKRKAGKLFKRFDKWGFRTVAITALLPPPFPLVPVLLAAGGLQYPRKKFLGALTLGRSIRYFLIAGIGSLYARPITAFFNRYYKAAVIILVTLAVIGGIAALFEYRRSRRKNADRAAVSPNRAA
ncbi:MAG TPA: VTT domain-containing protein [Terriglobales bacterium]|nr:VTT domain-containing protein [Terriglobales bacterium]HUK47657.1 VTT domain-containing protein [Terriglobales bacterium]